MSKINEKNPPFDFAIKALTLGSSKIGKTLFCKLLVGSKIAEENNQPGANEIVRSLNEINCF